MSRFLTYILKIFPLLILIFISNDLFAVKYRYPSSLSSITAASSTYCQGAAATALSVTVTNSNCGVSGPGTDIATTINWYSSNDASPATPADDIQVSGPTASTTATTVFSYTPSTASGGTLYYYYVITWADPDGASACLAGTLTSTAPQMATVIVNPTGAQTFTVNTTADAGAGSLRQAITDANAACGNATIIFDLGVGGPFTITINSSLPAINNTNGYSITIDGWENGANDGSPNTVPVFNTLTTNPMDPVYKIILGNNNNVPTGLVISGNNNIIRGLVIPDFGDGALSPNDIAITISGNSNQVIGCFVGMNDNGTTKGGARTYTGISISGGSNQIGNGTAAGANLISGVNGGSDGYGVVLTAFGATGNTVKGNMIGLQKDGSSVVATANQGMGVYILPASGSANTVGGTVAGEGNIISGNTFYGVGLASSAGGNFARGNIIGLRADGVTFVTSNAQSVGVWVVSPGNTIGGNTVNTRNIISGNQTTGVYLNSAITTGNLVQGNYLGIDKTGTAAIAGSSQDYGVFAFNLAASNTIGGSGPGEGNVISGNTNSGINLNSIAAGGHTVLGNIIGLQADGLTYLASNPQFIGIDFNGSPNNIIGGSALGARNIISGNSSTGLDIGGAGSTGNIVKGNYIGIAGNGTTFISGSSQSYGVSIIVSAASNTIGGTGVGEGNVISGNSGSGISISSAGAAGNTIIGNIIGPQADGITYLTSTTQSTGINIQNSPNTTIGGNSAAARNIISANQTYGVYIQLAASTDNIVKGNYIGIAGNGTSFITGSSQDYGVYFSSSAGSGNTIGGSAAGEGNVISGNINSGVICNSTAVAGNSILGNIIGPQADGLTNLASNLQSYGVYLLNSPNNTIGGNTALTRNIISANTYNGITIDGALSTGNIVKGNYIGIDKNGTSLIAGSNQDIGIQIWFLPVSNTIGGTGAGEGNVISGNNDGFGGGAGISMSDGGAGGNTIRGNIIGPQADGITYLASSTQSSGIYIDNAPDNTIGGSVVNAKNIISGNGDYGIYISNFSSGNNIKGNYIGPGSTLLNITGATQDYGLYFDWSGDNNIIGGSLAGEPNTIAFNTVNGIYLTGPINNLISRNPIYNNIGKPINLNYGANQANNGKPVPDVTTATSTYVIGTSEAGNTVEVFKNTTGNCFDASTYLGTTTADGSGNWTLSGLSLSASDYILATATNGTNNTSEFSGCDTVIDLAISTSAISPSAYCAGSAVSVPYTKSGTDNFNAGNIFTAQLSDAAGSFAAPTNIGTLASTASGTIAATIPPATPAGSGYRIRVISSDPAIIGSNNGTNLAVSTSIPLAPVSSAPTAITCGSFNANWIASAGATTYYLDVATDAGFTSFVTGYNNLDVGNVIIKAVTGLAGGTAYFYRVRAYNACGTSGNSGTETATTLGVPGIFAVDNLGDIDDGLVYTPGDLTNSLRKCIRLANANCGHDIINFNLGAGGPFTILIDAALPNLTDNDGATIDGWENGANDGSPNTVPVFNTTPGNPLDPVYKIILGNNNNVPTGLVLASDNNIIKGLVLQNFGDGIPSLNDIAITITGNTNQALGCYIGMDVTGTVPGTKTYSGIEITGLNNIVGDGTVAGVNLITGMNGGSSWGIRIFAANGNIIRGNIMGLKKDGSTTGGTSQQYGVFIEGAAGSNIIGGGGSGEGNVISENSAAGISLRGTAITGNTVAGNIIGPRADGVTFISLSQDVGIEIRGSPNNIIGGNTALARNIISANWFVGLDISLAGSTGNIVKGNYIGIDKTGTTFIAGSAQEIGVSIGSLATSNTIGGSGAGEGNVISGNNDGTSSAIGLEIISTSGANNVVGNTIGTQADGVTNLASNAQGYGVLINGSPNNIVGGNTSLKRNIISANLTTGVIIQGGSTGNIIQGNYIGPEITATSAIAGSSQDYGVWIVSPAASNTIGGTGSGEGNVLSGNTNSGIALTSAAAAGNTVVGNIIGPQANGNTILTSNAQSYGIYISSLNNTIGGNTVGARNIISANEFYGVYISGAGSTGNAVKGNYIGIDISGTLFIAGSSQDFGVWLTASAAGNTIGGTGTGEGNVISGNGNSGIYSTSSAVGGNTMVGNLIGPQADGVSYLAFNTQSFGIQTNSSPNNIIGGNTLGARNIISGNESYGIYFSGASTTGNIVKGNYIGIDKNGTTFITGSTQDYGVYITNSAASNTIGGSVAGEGNVISGNSVYGIYFLSTAAAGNTAIGNIIGPQADGITYLASNVQLTGIFINNSPNNIIGGNIVGARNIISANETYGVYVTGASSTGNLIKGNYIGIDKNGTTFIAGSSQNFGIVINAAGSNTIGGIVAGEGNVISGNSFTGIYFTFIPAAGNSILGNIIGPQADGTNYLGSNAQFRGIEIIMSPNNTIGGNTALARNIISANELYGIYIQGASSTGNIIKGNYIGPNSALGTIAGSSQDFGFYIQLDANNNTIGGTGAGESNIITLNTTNGIYLFNTATVGNKITRNPIYSNTGKAINLNYGASQGNNGKAVPVISTVTATTVSGTSGAGNTIEVFKNTTSASAQDAVTYLGTAIADGSGNWSLGGLSLVAGEFVVATATDGTNNTSELAVTACDPQTYTVNSTNDVDDGLCDGAHCSLREAINAANANCGHDTVVFNLGAGGPFTIALTTALPNLTDNRGATIDGFRNTGNNGTPNTVPVFSTTVGTPMDPVYKIILGNTPGTIATGLVLASDSNVIKGLVLQNFGDGTPSANDISITITGNTNQVLGCYIGMDVTGTTQGTNTAIGTQISGAGNKIGNGTAAGANLISGMNGNQYGINISGATATTNTIRGNMIGLQKDGSTVVAGALQSYGIFIQSSAASNIIGGIVAGEGNVISGNKEVAGNSYGIVISSAAVAGNSVLGNIIGPQANGTSFVAANTQTYGIFLSNSRNNIVGGNTALARNIISANEWTGLYVTGATATGNLITGNYIGIDKNGTNFITSSTQNFGIFLGVSATTNFIGGNGPGEGNLISGNSSTGIYFFSGAVANTILGNIIGPQADGATWVAGNLQGLGIKLGDSPSNIVGGNTAADRNIISANEDYGIEISGLTSTGNIVKGNYIGTDITGTAFITGSTQSRGVNITSSSISNIIGGSAIGEGNLISGNKESATNGYGIVIGFTAAGGNTVLGNIIGTQADGATWFPSNAQYYGIYIDNSPDNIIGGNIAGARNIISGNESVGIVITRVSSTGNIVKGNYIGLDITGTTFIANSGQDQGISISSSAGGNIIGGSGAGEGNVISGNSLSPVLGYGILTSSDAAAGNSILGNIIGPQADAISNVASNTQNVGVFILGSPNNIIGGTAGTSKNIISANLTWGVFIQDAGSTGNIVKGNYIGPGSTLANIAGSNQDYGIYIYSSAANNTIGGSLAGEPNQIAFNTVNGVYLSNVATTGNLISRNPIYSNTGKPINLNYGASQANGGKAIPVITSVTPALVSGTSVAGDIVEVFKNTAANSNDATTYLGAATADGVGNWSLAVALVPGDFILANATDGSNNTSEFAAQPCNPATYTVNSTNDVDDGLCDGAHCSLREAINAANSNCGHDTVVFNLGAGGPFTIALTTALPNLIDNRGATIDGFRNTGNNGTPNTVPVFSTTVGTPMDPVYKIILGNTPGTIPTGLVLASDSNEIKGLVLQDFGDGTPSANDIAITITGNVNKIIGNNIGMDAGGTTRGTKTYYGVYITGANNRIGDGTAAGADLISGMNVSGAGVFIQSGTATGNSIKGNIIGLQKDGSAVVTGAPQSTGVFITGLSYSNTIGGTLAGEGNVISGNSNTGIYINTSPASGNSVLGNMVGPQANGTNNVSSNAQSWGIYISNSPNNTIGGNTSGARNFISANTGNGVAIFGASSTGNVIKGNYIGIDKNGTSVIAGSIQNLGIHIYGDAVSNTIGGSGAGEGNVISGNNGGALAYGIGLYSSAAAGNAVLGNIIGPQADGLTYLASNAQQRGIHVDNSPNNTIGGNTAGAKNIISANELYGVAIWGAGCTGNTVKGNYIGIDKNGTTFITGSTQDYGVAFIGFPSSSGNTIGGSLAGEGNVISGNSGYGIYTNSSAVAGNSVLGNIIGPQADGTSYVSSNVQPYGIYINSSPNNTIGGNTALTRNIISANETYGVFIEGAGSTGNVIKGNYIGIAQNGTTFITGSTQDYGVYTFLSAASNTIGGSAAGEGNVISGNSESGVWLNTAAGAGNLITGNIVGPQADGITYLASNVQTRGIAIVNSPNNVIGGTTALTRNIISGNENWGIWVGFSGSNTNIIKGNYIGPGSSLGAIAGSSQDYGFYMVADANNNTIGGTGAGEENIIALNTTNGIYLFNTTTIGNKITRNPIYSNTGKPINLNYGASQGNSGKAIPVITSASATTVNGTSGTGNIIEVFKNTTTNCFDATVYVGTTTADGAGNWTLGGLTLVAGDYVLATATDASNNTSEFCACTEAVLSNTITTSAIAPTTLCKGGSITVAYTITGTYNAGNVFTAQLSNATGSFAAPTNIGNVTSTTNTSITATIPIGTASGTGYRIRVVSSDPAVIGTNNGSDLTVPADGGAGTWTWVGGISTNWFDRCNWDKKSLPDLSSDVTIPGGTANDPTISGAAANCKTITIDTGNSGIVNLNSTAGGVLNVAQ